jgi:retron-type reverse transcriptase
VLQTIIYKAVHPIVEYQADSHSFGFRPNRSGLDAISLIANRLNHLPLNNSRSKFLPSKVNFKISQEYKGLKMKRLNSLKPNSFCNYHKFISVNIEKCSDNIPFTVIQNHYPLSKKYDFLLKA